MESASAWPEHGISAHRRRAIEELVRGRELAFELQVMVRRPSGQAAEATSLSASSAHRDLVAKILGSFTDTISILNSAGDLDEVSEVPAAVNTRSWDVETRKSEDSSGSYKPSAISKDRRGCYKRRKPSDTWTKETPSWIDDGYAWRKYGQKVILNAEYPRNYFRCTHKFDQDCRATKQVQKIQDKPPLFRTTYHGRHTCKSLLKAPQIIFDSAATAAATAMDSSSILLNFQSENKHEFDERDDSLITMRRPFVKQGTKEESRSLFKIQNPSSSSSDDYFNYMPPEFASFETMNTAALSSGSDHGDVISSGVYSCAESTHTRSCLDVGSVSVDDFDDVLQFEF